MPATEIVRTVIDVKVPTEIDRNDATNRARHQDLFDLLVSSVHTVVECHRRSFAYSASQHRAPPGTVSHRSTIGFSVITSMPRSKSSCDVLTVETIHCCYHQQIRFRLIAHLIEVGEGRTFYPHHFPGDGDSLAVDVTESDKFEKIGILLDQWYVPTFRSRDHRFPLSRTCASAHSRKQVTSLAKLKKQPRPHLRFSRNFFLIEHSNQTSQLLPYCFSASLVQTKAGALTTSWIPRRGHRAVATKRIGPAARKESVSLCPCPGPGIVLHNAG